MIKVPHVFFLFLFFLVIQKSFGMNDKEWKDQEIERHKFRKLARKDCFVNNKCWFDKHCGSKGRCVKQKSCKKGESKPFSCATYGRKQG